MRDVFDWPVFNFADIYVSIGAVLLSIKLIFFDK
ncbi:signal peptidase II [Thermobrachium celere]